MRDGSDIIAGHGRRATDVSMDTIVNLCKRRGIILPNSEIYGGLRSTWDYGPLGVELKNNVKRAWWRWMVQLRDDVVGLDSAILLVAARLGGLRPRRRLHRPARRVPELPPALPRRPSRGQELPELRPGQVHRPAELQPDVQDVRRPGRGRHGRRLAPPGDGAGHLRRLQAGPVDVADEDPVRHRADRQVVPQRDHPGQLHLPDARVRADGDGVLRQAGHGRAVAPDLDRRAQGVVPALRLDREPTCACASTRRTSSRTTRSARSTSSTRSRSPTGASSRASRTAPTSTSRRIRRRPGTDLTYFDDANDERFIPYVIEPAGGADRATLAFLIDAYHEDEAPAASGKVEKRNVLKLHRDLAPIKVAVLPLSRNEQLSPLAREVAQTLRPSLDDRLRRRRRDRPPVPPSRRGRHAVLRHRRLRHPRRRAGDGARARHDDAGAPADQGARAATSSEQLRPVST